MQPSQSVLFTKIFVQFTPGAGKHSLGDRINLWVTVKSLWHHMTDFSRPVAFPAEIETLVPHPIQHLHPFFSFQ